MPKVPISDTGTTTLGIRVARALRKNKSVCPVSKSRRLLPARIWNANEMLYKSFDNGDYVHVEGTAQLYHGAMQIIATKLHKVDTAEVDEADFVPLPAVAIDKLSLRLGEILRGMDDPALQTLADEPGYLQINSADARKHGIDDQQLVWISSRRGKVLVRAQVTDRANEGAVYMTYQWWVGACNELTVDHFDPVS